MRLQNVPITEYCGMKTMIIDAVIFQTMGDVLMCTPVFHALKQKYPDAKLRVHTMDQYKHLLDGNEDIDMIVTYPTDTYMDVYAWCEKNPGDMFLPLNMASHYDTCWHHNDETKGLHMIDFYARRAGFKAPLEDKHIRYKFTFMPLPIGLHKPYVVMHTTTLLETKDWPIQYFNHLAQMIKTKLGIQVVQVGGPKDMLIDNIDHHAMGLSYAESSNFINQAGLYIGVDSGNSYIAEAAGIPAFIIMGSTQATAQAGDQTGPFVGPVGPNIHYIEPKRPENPNCRPIPCYNHCVINSTCIVTISVDDVFKQIASLYEKEQ